MFEYNQQCMNIAPASIHDASDERLRHVARMEMLTEAIRATQRWRMCSCRPRRCTSDVSTGANIASPAWRAWNFYLKKASGRGGTRLRCEATRATRGWRGSTGDITAGRKKCLAKNGSKCNDRVVTLLV